MQKDSIKREQSQAGLSFAERKNFLPQVKNRLLLLLALLMTAATGAWAQEQWDVVWDFTAWSTETVTALKADAAASKTEGWSDVEKQADAESGADPTEAAKDNCFWFAGTVNEDGSLSANGAVIKELKGLKFNSDYAAKRSLAIAVNYPSTSLGDYAGGAYLWLGGGGSKQNCPCFTIPGVKAGSKITIEVESYNTSSARGIGLYKNSYAAENLIGEQFTPTAKEAKTWDITEDCDVVVWNTSGCHIYTIKVKAPAAAATGPEVAWDKATKTGTFTMPGGNVTLEPEYYPQATVADGGVTAADADARATTDDPLVKVDATKLTGAKKLMYFVSNSGTTAPAYDAEGWTDQLPNAEGFTQQGIVYVWYYPVGTDEGVDGATATYSDGDICLQSITARIAAAPTYAVTFAEGTDPTEWTASPAADVTKGQTVTVTYTGTKKVIGVKAEKKATKLTITIPATANAAALTLDVTGCTTWEQILNQNITTLDYEGDGVYGQTSNCYILDGNNNRLNLNTPYDPTTNYHWGTQR